MKSLVHIDKLVLCTTNHGKTNELRNALGGRVELLDLKDVRIMGELPETGNSFGENALQKARYVFDRCGIPCLADDSGLEVKALDGAPGVFSARYAGPMRKDRDNVQKLLDDLGEIGDRQARFRTVLALVMKDRVKLFEGIVEGRIGTRPIGTGGFGYDPIFIPHGHDRTFAQMTLEEKNGLSHRAQAMAKLMEWLSTHPLTTHTAPPK